MTCGVEGRSRTIYNDRGKSKGNRMQSVRYGLVLWCLAGALSPVSGISWGM